MSEMSSSMSNGSSSTTTMMTFNTNNLATMIFSQDFALQTTGQYVGAWFLAFILAVIWRALAYTGRQVDRHFIHQYSSQPIITKAGEIMMTPGRSVQAWRLSVNLPRAFLAYVRQSLAYLLMILVMTMNVGIFFAVTLGYFIGEFIFGRLSSFHGDD